MNLGGERGNTPLHYAALIDNIEAAEILVSVHFFENRSIDVFHTFDRRIIMRVSVKSVMWEIIRFILQH